MRSFAWFLVLIALGFAAIAVFTYPAWLLIHPYLSVPFHRLGERIGLLALVGMLFVSARRLGIRDRLSLGYGLPRAAFLKEMTIGLLLGVMTMLLVVGLMSLLGLLDGSALRALAPTALAKIALNRLLSGFAVAAIEETLIRGAMFTAIERESGATLAVLLTSVLYAASHFLASFHIAPAEVLASSGVDLLVGTLKAFAHPLHIVDAFMCLFAVGVALSVVRIINGNIAACLGLHAGWVWVMLMVHEVSQPVRTARLGFLLSQFDGFVGWLVFACTVLIALALRMFYSRRMAAASQSKGSPCAGSVGRAQECPMAPRIR